MTSPWQAWANDSSSSMAALSVGELAADGTVHGGGSGDVVTHQPSPPGFGVKPVTGSARHSLPETDEPTALKPANAPSALTIA